MSAMNYLIDSITEYFKNQPFDINQVDIVPFKTAPTWTKGKKLDKSHKKSISKGLKGHKISEETREKISLSLKGRFNRGHSIAIKTPKGVFSSTKSAAEAYNISMPTVKTWAVQNKNGFSIFAD
ncbi:MAG: hypothetical protein ACO3AW_09325 [Chitinophagaceae bacterium]